MFIFPIEVKPCSCGCQLGVKREEKQSISVKALFIVIYMPYTYMGAGNCLAAAYCANLRNNTWESVGIVANRLIVFYDNGRAKL